MQDLQRHEQFEIEVLQALHNHQWLDKMVFGGGTALRLCHGLPRYSVDLDFWLPAPSQSFFSPLKKTLSEQYVLTDAASKYYSYLFELRSGSYPNRLKIEIRKKIPKLLLYEWSIAFSFHAATQVKVKTFTLESLFSMKKMALLERHEIRDAYDLAFLLKKIKNPSWYPGEKEAALKIIQSFRPIDFNSTLGSLLPKDERELYKTNRFSWLERALQP